MKISIKFFYVIVISLLSVFQLIYVYDCFGQKSQAREELDVDPIDNEILFDLINKSNKDFHLILIYT
ncbi:MAG TPA: hypothetical protein PKV88_05610, partial [Bacteroidales bacterium]|nr:hypothetical protein [Bacteroidales bacterium]